VDVIVKNYSCLGYRRKSQAANASAQVDTQAGTDLVQYLILDQHLPVYRYYRVVMEKRYEFIDFSKIDTATRKRARSHAMKGKNAGKKLYRRSRFELAGRQRSEQTHQIKTKYQDEEQDGTALVQTLLSSMYESYCKELLSLAFPVQCTPRSQQIITQCEL
jgi:hypothetical protein